MNIHGFLGTLREKVLLEKKRRSIGTGYTLGFSAALLCLGFVGAVFQVFWDAEGKGRWEVPFCAERVQASPVIPCSFSCTRQGMIDMLFILSLNTSLCFTAEETEPKRGKGNLRDPTAFILVGGGTGGLGLRQGSSPVVLSLPSAAPL